MSIVAVVKVYDGIVLGADSMTQLQSIINGQQQVLKAYQNAVKIFRVGRLPVGILTYGVGNIGPRSIESFVYEFSQSEAVRAKSRPQNPVDVASVAQRFFDFMSPQYLTAFGALPTEAAPLLGFIIAGMSDGDHLASEFEFVLPLHKAPQVIRQKVDIGAAWRGVNMPFVRLMFGFDPTLEPDLLSAGFSQPEIDRIKTAAAALATQVPFDGMPLQDAIDYCKFIIDTTIGWCTFAAGAASCGGPVRLAVITRSGFGWITPAPSSIVEES